MTGRRAAIVVLTILAVAILGGFILTFVLLYSVLFLLVAGYLWTYLNGRRLHVQAQGPADRCEAGQLLKEEVTVHNHSRVPVLSALVSERSDLPGHRNSRVLTMPGRRTQTWRTETACSLRGYFTVGPFDVTTEDPLGIFHRTRTYGSPRNVLVYPPTVELPDFLISTSTERGQRRNTQVTHHVAPSAAWVREYAPGDSMRQIHWRSTARLGKLMVKEFDLDLSDEVWIVVDLNAQAQAGSSKESTLEYMVTIVASIARKFLEADARVGLLAYGDRPYRFLAESGSSHLWRLMESMALMKAGGTQALAGLLHREKDLFGSHSHIVIIATGIDPELLAVLRHSPNSERTTVVMVDRSTFEEGADRSARMDAASPHGIRNLYLVRKGDGIKEALSAARSRTA